MDNKHLENIEIKINELYDKEKTLYHERLCLIAEHFLLQIEPHFYNAMENLNGCGIINSEIHNAQELKIKVNHKELWPSDKFRYYNMNENDYVILDEYYMDFTQVCINNLIDYRFTNLQYELTYEGYKDYIIIKKKKDK